MPYLDPDKYPVVAAMWNAFDSPCRHWVTPSAIAFYRRNPMWWKPIVPSLRNRLEIRFALKN